MTKHKGLPKSIKIGQRDYAIHVRTEANDPELFNSYAYTMTTYDNIVLRKNMSRAQTRSTLLHELMHALFIVYGNNHAEVAEREDDESYDRYSGRWEHFFINVYQESMITLLRDNPELVAFLLED